MYEVDAQDLNVLKGILPLMSRHAAGYHPISYTVWYEYAKGKHPALRQCIDDELKLQERLTVALTCALYTKHLVEPGEQALMTARSDLLELVERVKQAVNEVNIDTTGFDVQLHEFQHDLATATTIEGLGGHVSAMLNETKRVTAGLGKLSTHLEQSKSEVRRLTDELHRVRENAQSDALSGLLNRRGFENELQRLAPKDGAQAGSLIAIMFDIDHFKMINDTYGHPLGDVVIAAVGKAIRDCLGKLGVAARYGGEEFAVLLQAQSITVAEQFAQSVRERVEQGRIRRRQNDSPIAGVTISAGVASWIPDEDLISLIERADRALYASKRAGRNRVTVDGK